MKTLTEISREKKPLVATGIRTHDFRKCRFEVLTTSNQLTGCTTYMLVLVYIHTKPSFANCH